MTNRNLHWRRFGTSQGNAAFLKIIRDRKSLSASELAEIFDIDNDAMNAPSILNQLKDGLLALLFAGFIDVTGVQNAQNKRAFIMSLFSEMEEDFPGAQLTATKIISGLTEILGISLTEIEKSGRLVTTMPLYGKPDHKDQLDIFVMMPFGGDFDLIYADHIASVARKNGFDCKRGDDFYTARSIMEQVWQAIYSAKICIADCTGRNPNVFYELGIAHTLGKPCILLTQSVEDIPFDIRHLRMIEYRYTPPGIKELEVSLERAIDAEMNELTKSD